MLRFKRAKQRMDPDAPDRQRSVLRPKFSGNELSDPSKKIIVKLQMLQSELENLKMEHDGLTEQIPKIDVQATMFQ